VIPTRDAGPEFAQVLEALREQPGGPELVVVDSGSTDGTAERAARAGARVERIEPAAFNHGRTRNLGASLCTGDAIAFLSQDARPRDTRWLAELVAPLDDPEVAGVCGRVVPRPDASPLVRRSVERDLVAGVEPARRRIDDRARWTRATSRERRRFAAFSNVSSCVRREVLAAHPFPELSFGEDIAWALAMLEQGRTLVYAPGAVVVHSHESELRADFARHRADARLLRALLDLRPSPAEELRTLAGELLDDARVLRGERALLRYGPRAILLRTAQALGRAVGAREAASPADRAALPGGTAAGALGATPAPERMG